MSKNRKPVTAVAKTATTQAPPDDALPQDQQRVADALRDPAFVASLGLRNGMSPEAIAERALAQLGG